MNEKLEAKLRELANYKRDHYVSSLAKAVMQLDARHSWVEETYGGTDPIKSNIFRDLSRALGVDGADGEGK